jgi:predicted ATP-binding protein involved in virulence
MITNTTLRLDRLSLRNFRCFAECTIDLDKHLTVLVAENGRGKTAILDAIGIAIGLFVNTIADTKQLHGVARTDIRLAYGDGGAMTRVLPTELVADGYVTGQLIHWSQALKKDKPKPTTAAKSQAIQACVYRLLARLISERDGESKAPSILPLVALYGTRRFLSEPEQRKKVTYAGGIKRLQGYVDCLPSNSSGLDWYKIKMMEVSDPQYATELSKNLPLVTAVQEAISVVLEPTGWHTLDWSLEQKQLVVRHSQQGELPLSHLSDGVRSMISLVIDIASRCAILNPHLREGSSSQTPGILLIDEVDMHLHPRWQQTVVGLLRQAFPSLQMILSTHSPHVLSTVDKNSIRVIRLNNGEAVLETPHVQTRGVESADVLATIMGVDPVPQVEEAKWLSDYRAIIEDGDLKSLEAQTLRAQLVDHFGSNHPLILDCDRLIRFQSFKRRRASQEEA